MPSHRSPVVSEEPSFRSLWMTFLLCKYWTASKGFFFRGGLGLRVPLRSFFKGV